MQRQVDQSQLPADIQVGLTHGLSLVPAGFVLSNSLGLGLDLGLGLIASASFYGFSLIPSILSAKHSTD